MIENYKNKTTVNPSTTNLERKQPSAKIIDFSISDIKQNCNTSNSLQTMTLNELYDTTFKNKLHVIEDLLYSGVYILAGAPKIGKSFLVAQIAYHVSTGKSLWGYNVHQGTVLYLALEDNFQRLQKRMARMFGVDGTNKLQFAICSKQLNTGLEKQLETFIENNPDTLLIIIDTLQKIREVNSETYSYADDYQIVGILKKFADSKDISIILVHHTRKTPSGDKFEMISGTTGLLGCADGAFVLQKEKRTDNSAVLDIVGRDQPDQKIYLLKDEEHLTWIADRTEKELWKETPDPILDLVANLFSGDNSV